MPKHKEIFDGKTAANLFKTTYEQAQRSYEEIQELIDIVKPMITTSKDAASLLPLVTELLKSRTKDNEVLVKMLTVQQRYDDMGDNDETLSEEEEEIKKLLKKVN